MARLRRGRGRRRGRPPDTSGASAYYEWYTRGWLPERSRGRRVAVLDIGCGSGQFLYFLRQQGFTDLVGIDLDRTQVEIGRELGLDCRCIPAMDHLRGLETADLIGLVAMLDILEHFTREELYPMLEAVAGRLEPGGRLIASVPNADSPHASARHLRRHHSATRSPSRRPRWRR